MRHDRSLQVVPRNLSQEMSHGDAGFRTCMADNNFIEEGVVNCYLIP